MIDKAHRLNRANHRKGMISSDDLLWDVPTAMEKLKMSRYSLMKLATDAEAVIRVGDRVYFSVSKLRSYIELIAG